MEKNMEEEVHKARENNENYQPNDSQFTAAAFTVVLVILTTLVLFFLWRRKKHARNSVLIVGLCDSGKTLLFSQLLHNRFVLSHTSVKENVGSYVVNNRSLKVVDIPGHERLRYKYLDEYKAQARGIIFMIDSVAIQKEVRDVAEFLYTLLSDSVVSSNSLPMLVLCNKQDETMAKGSSVIQKLLEKEMNLLRVTKSSQLESTSDTSSNNTFLGKKGKDFEFSHVTPVKVEFSECSVQKQPGGKDAQLDHVKLWLSKAV